MGANLSNCSLSSEPNQSSQLVDYDDEEPDVEPSKAYIGMNYFSFDNSHLAYSYLLLIC